MTELSSDWPSSSSPVMSDFTQIRNHDREIAWYESTIRQLWISASKLYHVITECTPKIGS